MIRKADTKDFPAIYELIQEFVVFQKTPEKLYNTPEQMLEEKDLFQSLVAEDEEKGIIGYACFFFAYYSWSGKALCLDDLYVKESHRGTGVGTELLQQLISFAKEKKCKKLRWQVSKWNKPAIEFYKKLGAIVDDVEMNCDLYL